MEQQNLNQILIDSTRWFIDQDPTEVVLTPRADPKGTRGAGGGRIYTPGTPRPAQRLKLISSGGASEDGISRGEGGQDRVMSYVIVGMPDAQITVGDTFTVDGNEFVVYSMDSFNGYEKKAYARQHGMYPSDG